MGDVIVRQTNGGGSVANFKLKTWEEYQGKIREEHHKVTCWGKVADSAQELLSDGVTCKLKGKISTNSYKNREGQQVYEKVITAFFVAATNAPLQPANAPRYDNRAADTNYDDSDIPF